MNGVTTLPTPALHYAFVALIDKTGAELCAWLKQHLFRFVGANWWNRNVCAVLNPEEQQKIKSGGWTELEDFDVQMLLKVLERNYGFLKGRLRLPTDGRDLIYEIRQIRNRCIGHRPVRGNDQDQLLRDIHTLQGFCTTILNAPKLAEELSNLSDQATRIQNGSTTEKNATAQTIILSDTPQSHVQPFIADNENISLNSVFSDTTLTVSQKKAVDCIEAFLKDNTQTCFVLKGYAGTGKTFLIGGIVRYLKQCGKATELLAPTGRAAHVMKERHKLPASTIHRHIYALNKLREFREVGENGAITYKFYFELRNNDMQHDSVFIIDEASMLSDVYTEAEFMRFGSGRLLRDLLEYINFDGNDYRKKIIFVGDDAQLPPVDMNFSPALDESYLAKYVRSNVVSTELSDVVRQNENSLILENATTLRRMLSSKNCSTFDFKSDGKTVTETTPEQFLSSYLDCVARIGTTAAVIIAYSNALAKDYNTAVREHLFPDGRLLEPKDRVMVVRNNYKYEVDLYNGQMGTVVSVCDDVETHGVFVNVGLDDGGNRKNTRVELHFRKAVLRFEGVDGTARDMPCLFIEDLLTSPHRELSSEQSKALYVDFRERHRNIKPEQAEFKEALVADPYFNALQLKYAYAVTCHKAQGGEWDTGYLDFQYQNKLNPMAIRWSYTALTRAAHSVVAINTLHHNFLTPLKQKPNQTPKPPNDTPRAPTPCVSIQLPENLAQTSYLDRQIYIRLRSLLPETYRVDGPKSSKYLSQWSVSLNEESGLINIYYNAKGKITSVVLDRLSPGIWSQSLLAVVHQLKGMQLPSDPTVTPMTGSQSTRHVEFFNALNSRCEDLHLCIRQVEDLTPFQSRYTYMMGDDVFRVDYYFNAKQQFTSRTPEDGLPEKLLQTLDAIHSQVT